MVVCQTTAQTKLELDWRDELLRGEKKSCKTALLDAKVKRDENLKLKANLRAANDTMAKMSEQVASCEATMKEVTERLHNYEDMEAKTVSLQKDLDDMRAENKALQNELTTFQVNLKDGKFVEASSKPPRLTLPS